MLADLLVILAKKTVHVFCLSVWPNRVLAVPVSFECREGFGK